MSKQNKREVQRISFLNNGDISIELDNGVEFLISESQNNTADMSRSDILYVIAKNYDKLCTVVPKTK